MDTGFLATFSVATLVGLVYALVNFLRNVANMKDATAKNTVVTQVIVWVAGVVVVLLAAAADIANTIPVFGTALADMDIASQILVGLCIGSAGSVVNDFFASRDVTRSSANPHFVSNDDHVAIHDGTVTRTDT